MLLIVKDKSDKKAADEITADSCGAKLTLVQAASGMRLQDMARAFGVNKSTLFHVMNGRDAPRSLLNGLRAVASLTPNGAVNAGANVQPLIAATVTRGPGILAKVSLLGRSGTVGAVVGAAVFGAPTGGLLGLGATFGVISALKKIGEMNGLTVRDSGDAIEIAKDDDHENDVES